VNRLLAAIAVAACLAFAAPAAAQRPPRVVPEHGETLVGRLPSGYSRLEPVVRSVAANQGGAHDLQRIGRLLEAASTTGDTRLVARADALLARQPAGNRNPALLRLRAYSAQHRHDFSGALRLLDELIRMQPRDADARLSRAEIQLVQGRIDEARGDCRALALGIDADTGVQCAASLALRIGEHAVARTLLDRLLGQFGPDDPRSGFALLARAEVAGRAGDADAGARYRKAMQAGPGDLRIRISYARHLRRTGHDAEVEAILAGSEQSDTAQLQRTLAALAAKRQDASALVAAQARRYALAHALGSPPELRDEAEFLLVAQRQPRQALQLALQNFETQRDDEDVDILVRAALAARDPAALKELKGWLRAQGLPLAGATGGSR
jgi:predicted Zn-dependent protease